MLPSTDSSSGEQCPSRDHDSVSSSPRSCSDTSSSKASIDRMMQSATERKSRLAIISASRRMMMPLSPTFDIAVIAASVAHLTRWVSSRFLWWLRSRTSILRVSSSGSKGLAM
jgi:hypothetical protein